MPMGPTSRNQDHAARERMTLPTRGVVVTRAADLTPQKLLRVWNGRFFRGKIGFIAGPPGDAKSQIATFMASTVSTGGNWPYDEGAASRGDVIFITAEDGAADTIRPRLEAAGADLDRVHIIEKVNDQWGPRSFNLLSDLGPLDEIIQRLPKPRLLMIDPINACLNSTDWHRFNPNSVPQVRALLGRLEMLAQHAVFQVNINSVLGSGVKNPEDALTVARRALALGFTSTVGVLHDGVGDASEQQ